MGNFLATPPHADFARHGAADVKSALVRDFKYYSDVSRQGLLALRGVLYILVSEPEVDIRSIIMADTEYLERYDTLNSRKVIFFTFTLSISLILVSDSISQSSQVILRQDDTKT